MHVMLLYLLSWLLFCCETFDLFNSEVLDALLFILYMMYMFYFSFIIYIYQAHNASCFAFHKLELDSQSLHFM